MTDRTIRQEGSVQNPRDFRRLMQGFLDGSTFSDLINNLRTRFDYTLTLTVRSRQTQNEESKTITTQRPI